MGSMVGSVVRDKDFYGREDFIAIIWKKLKLGHLLLAAPRRSGKTSVIYRLLDEPRDGFKVFHIDVEGLSRPSDLIAGLIEQIARDGALGKKWQPGHDLRADEQRPR